MMYRISVFFHQAPARQIDVEPVEKIGYNSFSRQ